VSDVSVGSGSSGCRDAANGQAGVRTILVAEDDPDLLSLLLRRLTKAGYDVITATDGEQALRCAEESSPRAAVLDMMMPKMTGTEVAQRMSATASTMNIPVVLISAGFQAEEGELPCGVAYRLRKPFGALALPELLDSILIAS
jgi:DNA-binding response OmpR family regulator